MGKRPIRLARRANPSPKLLEAPMLATQLAKVLSQPGQRIDPAIIRTHVKQGAPADRRGRLRLVEYAAWLNRRLTDGQ